MDELKRIREEIDEIDKELVHLFEVRMEKVVLVAEYKAKNKLPIISSSREEKVLQKNVAYLKNNTFKKPLEEFFISLMNISKNIQREFYREKHDEM